MTGRANADTPEQWARDLLERAGVEDAQSFTAGDVVEIANLLAELRERRGKARRMRVRQIAVSPEPAPGYAETLFALCDDGSLWMMREPDAALSEMSDWKRLPLVPLGEVQR